MIFRYLTEGISNRVPGFFKFSNIGTGSFVITVLINLPLLSSQRGRGEYLLKISIFYEIENFINLQSAFFF